jgi:hypothetical protein
VLFDGGENAGKTTRTKRLGYAVIAILRSIFAMMMGRPVDAAGHQSEVASMKTAGK